MTRPQRAVRSLRSRLGPRPSRADLKADATAGVVLGIESVPDSLASGLLAGVNPVSGLYAYLFGMVGAATFTGSALMAVQSTGAMALVVADTDLASRPDPSRALFTLAMLTGVVMIGAGLLGGGTLLRFVPTAVMTGFVTAVGINIVLGQLSNFTGYASTSSHRVLRALDLLVHPGRIDLPSLLVGGATIAAIVALRRTRLGPMGLVVAIVLGSLLAALLAATEREVALVGDLADLPRALPTPVLPSLTDLGALLLPAFALAFVGLVQGAAVSSAVRDPGADPVDVSKDFIGQGAGNIVAGVFQGMPVGGSMSASGLVQSAGARSRRAFFVAGLVMALVILALGDVVGLVAMPALAALLIIVGLGTVKPGQVLSVVHTGPLQTTVLVVTLAMTLAFPLQYAVLAGVALAIVLHVAEQSNRVTLRQLEVTTDGRLRDIAPPDRVTAGTVLVLQPYGSLFFASAPVLRAQLPGVGGLHGPAVVVIRLRGIDQLGLATIEVLRDFTRRLTAAGGTLKLVITDDRVLRQLTNEGLVDQLGARHVYRGNEWLGETVRRAHADGAAELAAAGGEDDLP